MSKFLFYDDKIINILIQDERPSGGAAVQAYGWIRGLSETGHDISVLTDSKVTSPLKNECKDVKLVPLYDNKKGIRWLRWIYYRLPYIYRQIKKEKPDYLYQGIPGWQSFILGILCRFLSVKYVLRISNDYLLDNRIYRNHSWVFRLFQTLGMRLSYCILCQNDYQLNIIRKKFPGKRTIKIFNPFFLNQNVENGAYYSREYIAWIGLYQYQKNLPLLYAIASAMKDEQFCIAGKEGTNCDEETYCYLQKLKELPNVRFVGFLQREQVLPFLSKARFLLNTSHYEGFSNTFLEAMSVGTPIISNRNVNPDDIITKFELGIIYENLNDLIHKYAFVQPEDYSEMSKNVRQYVSVNHDYKLLAKRLSNFLNN